MIRKISSEFDCIDSAERAVAAIRNSINDVSNISITPRHNNIESNMEKNNSGILGYSNAGQFFPFSTNLYESHPFTNTSSQNNNQPQEVILQISCTNDNFKNISSMLTSYGGLQIKEL